jgi:Tol biopolymer transport system component
MLSLSAAAQASDETVLVATPTVDGIDIYSADSSGEVTLVHSLNGFRVGDPIDQDSWFMSRYTDLTVSLDGSQIAFTAQRDGAWALFVYTRATDALLEIALPEELSIPIWSPDGTSMLLTAGASAPPLSDYVYDLQTQELNQITSVPQFRENSFHWMPDSTGLFYVGYCETCLPVSQALYQVSRDGSETTRLAVASVLAPSDSVASICHPTWSEPNHRIYFVIGCVGGGGQSNEYLYSVDLAGNVRAELSGGFNSLYSDEYNVRTINIHPSPFSDQIYITLASQGGDSTGLSNRRILHFQAPDIVNIVYEQTQQDEAITSSSMSPNGAAIALVTYGRGTSNGYLEVIDVTTEERIVGQGTTPSDVCDVFWSDEDTLFYTVDPTGACDVARAPQSVWVLDITSGATQEVTSELGANVWMLRRVVVTAPLN